MAKHEDHDDEWCVMHDFITGRDRESYAIPESPKSVTVRKGETPEQARARTLATFKRERSEALARLAQRIEDERAAQLATHAVHESQRPHLVGDDETRAINARYNVPDTYAATVPERYRKAAPPVMDAGELSEGPNLPHRDESGISELARDVSRKVGYYRTGVDAYLTDAYADKRSPIDQKANARHTYTTSTGEVYVLPHGAGTKYRRTVHKKTGRVTDPHQQDGWGKPHTSRNKHLAYWRRPTESEALRNLGDAPDTREDSRWQVTIPRDMLGMLAQVIDIQAQRGRLHGPNRADALRAMAATVAPGEDVTLEWFTPADVMSFTQGVPKRYKAGQFGEFLKATATHVKLHK